MIIRDLVSLHPAEFESDTTMFDRLVRFQHFGMPTRLLDVTLNPLVALYFAVQYASMHTAEGRVLMYETPTSREKYYDSDAVSCVANLANLTTGERESIRKLPLNDRENFNKSGDVHKLIQFVRAEKSYFEQNVDPVDLFRPVYVVPRRNNRRIIAQAGAFMLFGLPSVKAVAYARSITNHWVTIPASAKGVILEQLDFLGINSSTLFPELEKAAIYIASKYKN